jgi:hypothetical protein
MVTATGGSHPRGGTAGKELKDGHKRITRQLPSEICDRILGFAIMDQTVTLVALYSGWKILRIKLWYTGFLRALLKDRYFKKAVRRPMYANTALDLTELDLEPATLNHVNMLRKKIHRLRRLRVQLFKEGDVNCIYNNLDRLAYFARGQHKGVQDVVPACRSERRRTCEVPSERYVGGFDETTI